MASPIVGIDFGTTNSAIGVAQPDGHVALVPFADGDTTSRSVLLALQQTQRPGKPVHIYTGNAAIEQYLATGNDPEQENARRFIQSLKSHLSARSLTGTEIFNRQHRFEDLVARILADLRARASEHLGSDITHALVGRPVNFVGANNEADNAFAEDRLRHALQLAGFKDIHFAMEPVAAAYAAEHRTPQDGLLLIGDFGGGTTDFSLVRMHHGRPEVLGSTGIGIAGDAFDARVVRYLIAPALGSESLTRELGGKTLPALPAWIYANLERWHTLSFLKTHAVTNLLRSTRKRALEPEKIEALIAVIDHDLGFQLHRSVRRLKIALTTHEHAEFSLDTDALQLRETVHRATFEQWVAPELSRMESTLDDLFAQTSTPLTAVDRVFLTGGTSLVPAVRRLFTTRFGADRVQSGSELTSVAQGLALMAAELT